MHTILVVDDEEVVRSVVRDMLESDGYSILDTDDPQHALRIARERPIHLLLSDVVMPLMKGPELATKLLAVSPSVQALNDKVRQVLEHSSPFARPTRSF